MYKYIFICEIKKYKKDLFISFINIPIYLLISFHIQIMSLLN